MTAVPTPSSVPVPDGLALHPFRALRYTPAAGSDLAALTSPPYDVIDDEDVTRLEADSPYNAVRLILPRDDTGPGSRYPRAARTLATWVADGILARDDTPALYVYEETADGHTQRGLVGAVALAEPEAGIILPHENTMAGPVSDRLALTEATEANLEPIFLLYEGGGTASRVVSSTTATTPLLETTTLDGTHHRIWAVTDPAELAAVAADLLPRRAVIADGHHRYATYRRYQADRHAAGSGPGPWDSGLAFLVDASASGPQVHPIHRVVESLPVEEAARLAASGMAVRRVEAGEDGLLEELAKAGQDGHAFAVTDGSVAYLLTRADPVQLAEELPADRSAAFRRLDVTVAHLYLIRRLWNLPDGEETVGYRHDAASAIRAARASGGTALLMNATPVGDVLAVAAAGERMPRKSTLFTPKPRSGLLVRPLDDA